MKNLIKLGSIDNNPNTIFPVWKIEDQLVDRVWNKDERAISALIALTSHAFHRYDDICNEYAQHGNFPYVWPVLEEERDFLHRLLQRYPVSRDTSENSGKVLNKLLKVATIDEVALGAFNALRCIAYRAGARIHS